MKPVLTISLLCSGQKNTVRKCLDSLKPIMEQVSSELIIVDTGCDEKTHELLLEYTDQVLPFTWCNDFAKARNVGLKAAKGEWFLYLDDDENFVDVKELVDFFQSGEYKKFGQACYIVRNYSDLQGQRYQDMWVSRMIRIGNDTHFQDRIHEYLTPVHGKNKLINSWVDHYGYVYATPEEKKKHDQRNLELLKGVLEDEPENMRIRAHLAQEYLGIPDHQSLLEICDETLLMLKKNDEYYNSYRQTFYMGKLLALLNLEEFEKAEEFFETAAWDKRNDQFGRAGLCGIGSEIYYRKQDYATCDKCCLEFIKVFKETGGEFKKVPYSPVFIQSIFYRSNRNNVFCMYICSRLCQGDAEALKEYFWQLGWEEENFSVYTKLIPDTVDALAVLPCEEEFVPIAQKLLEDERVRELTVEAIQKAVEEKGDDVLYPLARLFGQAQSQHYYVWYLKVIAAAEEQQRDKLVEAYGMLFKKVVDCLELEDRIFQIAEDFQIDLDEIFAKIPFDQWKQGVDSFCQKSPMDKVRPRKAFLDRHCKAGELRYDYLDLKVSEVEAVITVAELIYENIKGRMKVFSAKCLAFYRRFFLPEAFEGEMEMLPAPCRAAVVLRRAIQADEAGDIAAFREEITKCIGLFGPLDKGLQNYAKRYAEWREEQLKQNGEADSAAQELQVLARQVKQQIRRFVEQGEKTTAQGVLQQLKSLVPNDPELSELEELCRED